MNLLHWTWIHTAITTILGGSGAGIIAIKTGLGEFLGGWIGKQWVGWADKFLNHRKKKRRMEDSVTIGKLQQEVKDQGKTIKGLVKNQIGIMTKLEACQAERTECRADLKNILFRVDALERGRR